jgi:hypothetical protein
VYFLPKGDITSSQGDLLTTWRSIERAVTCQIIIIKMNADRSRIQTPIALDQAQYSACFGYITFTALHKAHANYIEKERLLGACTSIFTATTGLPCAHRVDNVRRLGVSLLPSDFHIHWYWDRYTELSAPTLEPIRTVTQYQTTSTKRLPSAFEATEPRERRCGQCRLPGHTRNSLRRMHNLRQLNQEFQQDQLAMQPRVALQELESLSPEPENPATEVDTRPIWPGRIELIYQAYLAEKTTWLAANPTVQPAQYRSKRGLQRWSKAACDRRSLRWRLPLKRLRACLPNGMASPFRKWPHFLTFRKQHPCFHLSSRNQFNQLDPLQMEVPFEQGLFPSKLQLMLEGINRQMALVGKPRKMRLFQHIDTMEHHDSDSDSNSDIETDVLSTVLLLLLQQPSRRPPTPSNRRWTCKGVVDDLLTCGNPTRIHNQLRMQLES